jgi:hypothetical protein
MQLAKGTAEKWESLLHNSALHFITLEMEKNPEFLKQKIDVQIKTLHDKAKEMLPDQEPLAEPDIYAQAS